MPLDKVDVYTAIGMCQGKFFQLCFWEFQSQYFIQKPFHFYFMASFGPSAGERLTLRLLKAFHLHVSGFSSVVPLSLVRENIGNFVQLSQR